MMTADIAALVEEPERIRVGRDADGFWTCREAVRGSQEYVRADLYGALARDLAVAKEEYRILRTDYAALAQRHAAATRERDEMEKALRLSERREAGLRANLDEMATHAHAIARIVTRGALRPDPVTGLLEPARAVLPAQTDGGGE